MAILRIALALLVLGLLIFIHEFGHYIVGKKSGIGVVEFAIGFGPKVFSWQRKETTYSLRLIPVGGFTQFEGEDEQSQSETAMNNQPVWKRMLTILAGPVFNIVFAFLCTVVLLFAFGETNTKVAEVVQGGSAQQAGLVVGDEITSINGRDTVFAMEAMGKLYALKNKKETVELTIRREGAQQQMQMQFDDEGKIGVGIGELQRYGFLESLGKSARWCYAILYDTFATLGGLFTGAAKVQDMGGMVAIVGTLGMAIRMGVYTLLKMTVIISLSLGIMNLLPLPALDGGRLVLLIVEGIRRKPMNPELEARIHFGGMVVLFSLMAMLVVSDLMKLFAR